MSAGHKTSCVNDVSIPDGPHRWDSLLNQWGSGFQIHRRHTKLLSRAHFWSVSYSFATYACRACGGSRTSQTARLLAGIICSCTKGIRGMLSRLLASDGAYGPGYCGFKGPQYQEMMATNMTHKAMTPGLWVRPFSTGKAQST